MIAIIDYKAGNLTSVVKALTYLNAPEITVTQDPDLVRKAAKIVLPGVGHFQATQLLTDLGLTEAVRESVAGGTWFLGVCVGLQWLFEGSTEAPATAGLGHFPGACERFPAQYEGADLKSPHVGWNSLEEIREDSKLLRGNHPRRLRLLHPLVARAVGKSNRCGYKLWWPLHRRRRTGQCHGRPVPSGEIRRCWSASFDELY